jgi:hypothetical protein
MTLQPQQHLQQQQQQKRTAAAADKISASFVFRS